MPAGYGSGNVSLLDRIIRTCTNSASEVIAIQYISLQVRYIDGLNVAGMALVNTDSLSTNRFRRTYKPVVKTVKSPSTSGNNTIAGITTKGAFDSFTVDSDDDVVTATYTGAVGVDLDLVMPINTLTGVLVTGDTI